MKFRKKPVVIEAKQWFKHGDHLKVVALPGPFSHEGGRRCHGCGQDVDTGIHGWIVTLEGGHIVCPGDWIIQGIKGEFYPCKPDIFEKTYEPV